MNPRLRSLLRTKIASDPKFRFALREEIARWEKGKSVPLKNLPPEFVENIENPPDSVLRVREEMMKKALREKDPFNKQVENLMRRKVPSSFDGAKVTNLSEEEGNWIFRIDFKKFLAIKQPSIRVTLSWDHVRLTTEPNYRSFLTDPTFKKRNRTPEQTSLLIISKIKKWFEDMEEYWGIPF